MYNFDLETALKYAEFTNDFEKVASDKGEVFLDYDNKVHNNITDSVKSSLVKAVGKNVEYHASQILTGLKIVDKLIDGHIEYLKQKKPIDRTSEGYLFVFGLRKDGVDWSTEVFYKDENEVHNVYKAFYFLTVVVEPNEYTPDDEINVTMSLFRDRNFCNEIR